MKIEAGCMAFLVDNPHPFMVVAHIDSCDEQGWCGCVLTSRIHNYTEAFLHASQLERITDYDEIVVEIYAKELD